MKQHHKKRVFSLVLVSNTRDPRHSLIRIHTLSRAIAHLATPELSTFTALPLRSKPKQSPDLSIAFIQPYYDAINRRRIQAQEEHEDSTSQSIQPPTPGDRRHLKPLAASRIDSSTEIQPAREEGRAILVNVRGLPRQVLPVRLRQLVHQP